MSKPIVGPEHLQLDKDAEAVPLLEGSLEIIAAYQKLQISIIQKAKNEIKSIERERDQALADARVIAENELKKMLDK